MIVEDIITVFNKELKRLREEKGVENKGFFVLQKNIDQDVTFKAYKMYSYTLWYIYGKHRSIYITVKHSNRAIDAKMDEVVKNHVDMLFVEELFKSMTTEYWQQVINGTYGIDNIEYVSNTVN